MGTIVVATIGILVIWGGLALSIWNAVRKRKKTE